MAPFAPATDRFRQASAGADWYELLLGIHVTAGMLDGYFSRLAEGLPVELGSRVRAILDEEGAAVVLESELRAAIAADPSLADRLALWGRSRVGDTLLDRAVGAARLRAARPDGPAGGAGVHRAHRRPHPPHGRARPHGLSAALDGRRRSAIRSSTVTALRSVAPGRARRSNSAASLRSRRGPMNQADATAASPAATNETTQIQPPSHAQPSQVSADPDDGGDAGADRGHEGRAVRLPAGQRVPGREAEDRAAQDDEEELHRQPTNPTRRDSSEPISTYARAADGTT